MTGPGHLVPPEAVGALVALLAAIWIALALALDLRRRQAPVLPNLPDSGAPPPPTTILLPVRDEEANLAACAATLVAQGGAPALRIVDDGSTDRTAAILARIARDEPRVTALAARPPAPGWGGKVNALATGFAGVSTPWILLTDADTRHQPDLLARAHAAAAEHRLDALSLSGRQLTVGLGESLLTPAAYALLDLMLGDWRPFARGEGPTAIANGQYFLLKSSALRAIGGFAAISGDPLDDVALAGALRAGGFRVGFRRAGAALKVRMYEGFDCVLPRLAPQLRPVRRRTAGSGARGDRADSRHDGRDAAGARPPLASDLCRRLARGSRSFRDDPQEFGQQPLYWSLFSP